MAAVYRITCQDCFSLVGDITNIRVSYFVFYLIGFVVSILILIVDLIDRLNSILLVIYNSFFLVYFYLIK